MSTVTDTPALSLKQVVLGDLEHELAITRRVLERIPDEHLAWKPHEKSMSLGGLATHVSNLLYWQLGILGSDEFDLAAAPPPLAPPASREEVLRRFDDNAARVREALAQMDDAVLLRTWTLRHGDHVISQQPKAIAIRTWVLSHSAHHRGQLSVYLRLLDVPVPSIYGPSADER